MDTRELALISVFSALWTVSQIYLGPVVGQITTIHGAVQRFMGWFLLLILAELSGRFGRATLLAAIASLATRIVRRSGSLYVWTVSLGYALGGAVFDALAFMPRTRRIRRFSRRGFLLVASLLSGVVASLPYLLYKLLSLGLIAFTVWLPVYVPRMLVNLGLNVLGTSTALLVRPQVRPFALFSDSLREDEGKPFKAQDRRERPVNDGDGDTGF